MRAPIAVAVASAGPRDVPPPDPTAGQIRDTAKQILSRPEFRPPVKTLFERIRDALIDQLDRLVSALVGGGRGNVVAWIVLVVGLVAVGYLLYRLLRAVERDRAVAGPGSVVVEERRPAREWLDDAAAYEAAGQWRDAIRARYRALIADLARRGLVDEIPGRTDGEYRLEMRESAPRSADDFAAATDVFEEAWYGNRATGPDQSASLRGLVDRVLSGVR
ncbi:MAG TPA: DUF4129 domain-containing protein [Acidimicrobiales bacterium]|nr:DUF4129 domain-containing protein [Acidimicrobiales bacterium]